MSTSWKPELLVPAGSYESLQTAVLYGADAVYLGGTSYGLRARAKYFDATDLEKRDDFAQEHGVKV